MPLFNTKFLTATAAAALLALPASALSVQLESANQVTIIPGEVAAAPDSEEPVTNEASLPEDEQNPDVAVVDDTAKSGAIDPDTQKEPITAVVDNFDPQFEGDMVMSADAMPIGEVQSVEADGEFQRLFIRLDDSVMAGDARVVSFAINSDLESDGEVVLQLTKAQFEEAIAAGRG